jgi:hypothetical protein
MRLRATVSNGPVAASLVRLPPDAARSVGGALRTETGAVVLAFRADPGWDYLAFWFPDGLDLAALATGPAPSPRVLSALGPEAQDALTPSLALGGDERGRGATILCRSKGPAGDAIAKVAGALERRGWRDVETDPTRRTPGARALTGPEGTVWMATSDVDRPDGLVSVLVEAP